MRQGRNGAIAEGGKPGGGIGEARRVAERVATRQLREQRAGKGIPRPRGIDGGDLAGRHMLDPVTRDLTPGFDTLVSSTDAQLADLVARIGEPGARAAWPALLRAARMQAQGQASVAFAPQTSEPATAFAGKPHSQALLAIARAIATDGSAALPAEVEVRRHILQQQSALRVVPVRSGSPGPDPQALGAPQRAGSGPKFPKPAAGAEPADRSAERRSDPADLAAEVIDTAHAGVFLLWRSVVEMGLEALFPPRANPGAARLTLAAALAGPDRKAAWSDPALHRLADHAPGEGEQPVAADTDWPRRLLAHWQDWRAPRPVVPSLRRLGASWLLQDRETEDWLALGTARECRRAAEATGSRPGAPAGDARDPVQDFTWFGAARRHDRLWAVLARFAYADLARRLGGLERSSAHWLSVNLLTGWGRLLPGDPGVIVLPRAPLDLVLRMSGMGGTSVNCGSGRRFLIQLAGPG